MPCTFGSERMILKASVTFSRDAPPPTSRKFAGSAPYSSVSYTHLTLPTKA
jgi:hypothetical protein